MPVSLPPISRRRFLGTSIAGGLACFAGIRPGFAAPDAGHDPNRFALLADTHVDADRSRIAREVNMYENLLAVGRDLLGAGPRPAAVLVGGDCAYSSGETGDYETLVAAVEPIRESGLPIHFALGNHDHRERFWDAVPASEAKNRELRDRHLAVIEAPHANWFVLDSLDVTLKTPGVLGEQQLRWLAKALDARKDKPALVMVHHNPDDKPQTNGLTDTAALFEVLLPRKHVKAVAYGHTHTWSLTSRDGLHLINLPPVAYVFGSGRPNGWVDMRLEGDRATLRLRCIDAEHPEHDKTFELAWR